ncbi:hypothetical protein LG315_06220 [Microbacterium marinum]|uniref:Uncharacterized protein n=2 Tax=Microbacterium marinum TaxID=421115 RepID=A0A7W7BR06_9MICO|nr:hypothetical protein [Microbacterium marinum]
MEVKRMIRSPAPALPVRFRGYELRAVGLDLWRVVDAQGRVIGHVAMRGDRVEARRFHPTRGAFLPLGDFCRLEDAVAALHHSR